MFEFLLARRYIKTQKRHSALTICSIVVAVTLMSMLFTGFATLRGCLRDAHYDIKPYHMRFMWMTSEQMDEIEKLPEVDSYSKSKLEDGTYQIDVMFKKNSLKDSLRFLQELAIDKLGVSVNDCPEWIPQHVDLNTSLMNDDLVDDEARKSFVQMLCVFYVFIVIIALALRLIIDTAFEISSRERERQFGVLQSIGATPKQIVRIMTAEGLMLSAVAIPIGLVIGIGCAYLAFRRIIASGIADAFFTSDKADSIVRFHVSPMMLLIAAVTSLAWVLFSAYGTGLRVVKKPPVEAISARSNTVKKVRRHTIMGLLFGWIGKLTSRNARRHPKRYIVTILSLTLSIALFAGVGSVMKAVSKIAEAPVGADFELDYDYNLFDILGYKDGMEYLEKSGYFSKCYYSASKNIKVTGDEKAGFVVYLSRDEYEREYRGKYPLSYDELRDSGGYLYVTGSDEPDKSIRSLEVQVNEVNVPDDVRKQYETDWETNRGKNKLSDEDDENPFIADTKEEQKVMSAGDVIKASKDTSKHVNYTFKIADSCKSPEAESKEDEFSLLGIYEPDEENNHYLIATLDQYEAGEYKMYGNFSGIGSVIECDIKSPDVHEKALKYVKANKDMDLWFDMFGEMQKVRTTISAYSIASRFVTGLIAVIAIVNMVNIVSTGIVNRKSELASMQCVGMTRGQLNKMAVIEGLQYAIFATIGAILLCMGGIFLTERFLILTELLDPERSGTIVKYSEPVWRVLAASGFTFIISVIAAIIPLRIMQKTSLIEQIRSVD